MKNILYLSLVLITFVSISCNSNTKKNDEVQKENILKEADLPSNPETIEEVATVFYYHLQKLNYEETEKFYSGKLHRFKDDEPKDCFIDNIETNMEEKTITFTDTFDKKNVTLNFIKKNDKYIISSYYIVSI